jgi:hypothetical protein
MQVTPSMTQSMKAPQREQMKKRLISVLAESNTNNPALKRQTHWMVLNMIKYPRFGAFLKYGS